MKLPVNYENLSQKEINDYMQDWKEKARTRRDIIVIQRNKEGDTESENYLTFYNIVIYTQL